MGFWEPPQPQNFDKDQVTFSVYLNIFDVFKHHHRKITNLFEEVNQANVSLVVLDILRFY